MGEWINKLAHQYTGILLINKETNYWSKQQPQCISKVCCVKEATYKVFHTIQNISYYMISSAWHSQKDKSIVTENRDHGYLGFWREGGMTKRSSMEKFSGDETALWSPWSHNQKKLDFSNAHINKEMNPLLKPLERNVALSTLRF